MYLIVFEDGTLQQVSAENINDSILSDVDSGLIDLIQVNSEGNFIQYYEGNWHYIEFYLGE